MAPGGGAVGWVAASAASWAWWAWSRASCWRRSRMRGPAVASSMAPFSNAVWYLLIAASVVVIWVAMAASSSCRSVLVFARWAWARSIMAVRTVSLVV